MFGKIPCNMKMNPRAQKSFKYGGFGFKPGVGDKWLQLPTGMLQWLGQYGDLSIYALLSTAVCAVVWYHMWPVINQVCHCYWTGAGILFSSPVKEPKITWKTLDSELRSPLKISKFGKILEGRVTERNVENCTSTFHGWKRSAEVPNHTVFSMHEKTIITWNTSHGHDNLC